MLLHLGSVNQRAILYCDLDNDLTRTDELPSKNWLLFAIADHKQLDLLYPFAEKCVDKEVLYICGAGEACSEIDDAFDFVVVDRKQASLQRELGQDDFDDSPITTWHHDFDEGFWFAAVVACHEEKPVEQVIVVNLTEESQAFKIKELMQKINTGWLPPD